MATLSSQYYQPAPTAERDLILMRYIDEEHLAHPFVGSRRICDALRERGFEVGRRHVRTLMEQMGIEALYRKLRLSDPAPGHKIWPYLLRNLKIDRVDQVRATDITYIPLARGFAYLVAIINWYSRKVLAWRLSNCMDSAFCVDALEEALARYGKPEIFNTDQGSQFTSTQFTDTLLAQGIQISMDGRERWIDIVFVERLWRSVKCEEVYLRFVGGICGWFSESSKDRRQHDRRLAVCIC
ncbi:MAG: IS3 family transposase [Sterolibacteriaceae bacterium]|uniref:IS3 family transposase n=1 Tax=Candidatus Methylophosphatis roskildensis TaxID=2899263 RepID=A0A9D7E1I1_9PROT|nr:IS3 family transposase [Candidatus Methylophosphatis roskildensis]